MSDNAQKLNIAVIAGGDSHEAQISLLSAATAMDNLDTNKYALFLIVMTGKEWVLDHEGKKYPVNKDDFSVVTDRKITFDLAFILIHGTPGEDGLLQGYFDMIGIRYSTPSQLGCTITFDKWVCNTLLTSMGYNCAQSVLLRPGEAINSAAIAEELGLPCFVKPNAGGSSFGAAKVDKTEDIATAIANAFKHGKEVIIESYLKGTEVTCGVFKHKNGVQVLPITEIVTENDFFDFEAKYRGESNEITPARISDEMTAEVQRITKAIYQELNLKGISRIDYIIMDGVPYLIEVNTVPGQSAESLIPQQAAHAGIPLPQLFDMVIEDCIG
jgi:D-alanine-D-alanine ligase